jgi:transcriptional regulator with XRE-family HTH domain
MASFKQGVGQNIKLIRKSKRITQEDLAELIGIHPRQLSKIETGEHFPSCKTFEKLCIALDIVPKELFDFDFVLEEEMFITGTDNRIHVKTSKSGNIYELKSKSDAAEEIPKKCTDENMSNTAKKLNKPVLVEYFDEKKTSKIVVFYPDGTEKVLKTSIDVEYQQNVNFIMNEFRKIAKDEAAIDYVKLALRALHNKDALRKLEGVIYGMKLSRNID